MGLSPKNEFTWDDTMENAFVASKLEIVRLVREGVFSFDPELTTCLSPDYSKAGMGWVLQQKTCECKEITPICCKTGWRLVLAGGKFCNPAESRYSPTEGEATAVVEGLRDTKYYTLGCKDLYIATDHKPLVSILGDRALDTIDNPRLLRIKEKTFWWNFNVVHVPGLRQLAADALSRRTSPTMIYSLRINPEVDVTTIEPELQLDMVAKIIAVTFAGVPGDKDKLEVITWTRLAKATQEDNTMVRLTEAIHRGFPESKHDVQQDLQEFHRYRHCLHTINNINCYKGRLIIPSKLRTAALEVVHSAHQGCSRMNNRVEQSIFWPQISVDVLRRRHECTTCIRDAPSQPAGTPVAPLSPSYPFQMVVADYFSLEGKNYLVVGDRYSGWLSMHEAGAGEFNGATMVKVLREQFSNFNIPEELATDGGPQMMSTEVQACLTRWGVRHRLSSAYFPHSNSRAELAVKAGKRLLRDNVSSSGSLATDKVMHALMQYRNTPLTDLRLSPAQIVFNRQLRDFLPVLPHKYKPSQEWSLLQEDRERALASRRSSDGSRLARYTKQQQELQHGTQVAVQNQTGRNPNKWDKTGTVIETRPHSQVVVRLDGSRRMTLRNMQFIKEILPMTTTTAPNNFATVPKMM